MTTATKAKLTLTALTVALAATWAIQTLPRTIGTIQAHQQTQTHQTTEPNPKYFTEVNKR